MITYGPCKYGYIEELYVEEHSRRIGIGKQLVKRLLNEYQNLRVWAIFLMTDATDAGVQSFYRSIGFKESKGHWLYMENTNN
jgi:ribosomal protein S18 acetylase RimI-like enzyme